YAIKQIYAPIKIPKIIPTVGKIKVLMSANKVKFIINNIIKDNDKNKKQENNLLSRLLAGRDNNLLTNEQLKSEMFSLLLAGHETTSVSLTWTIYLLTKNPHYIEKLRTEIQNTFGNNRPD